MITYLECPRCDHTPSGLAVHYMDIYECDDDDCGVKFCHACPGSNGGRECPECGSEEMTVIGQAYEKNYEES